MKRYKKKMGGPGFTWDYCWATRVAGLVLGESSGLLLVRSVSGRCYETPAAEVRCHNTHGEKSDYHSHADIFPFSCGQDSYGQEEVLIVGVAGLGDQIERLADSGLYKNRSVRGGGGG